MSSDKILLRCQSPEVSLAETPSCLTLSRIDGAINCQPLLQSCSWEEDEKPPLLKRLYGNLLIKSLACLMLDFHNPAVIEKDFLAVVKLCWEFVITLDYEWSVTRGQRPYRWTIWIYSLTRLCALMTIILNMIGFDSSTPIKCQLWIIFELIFTCLAFGGATFLIVLRIIAIWKKDRIVMAIAICAWIANFGLFIHDIARIHARWTLTSSVCEVLNPETPKITIIGLLVTEVVLLLTLLIGLLRLRVHGTMFALGQFLWKQGLIWLFMAIVSELPAVVFVFLNLNGKIYAIAILVTVGNKLDPVGKTRAFQPHVSKSRTHRDDNRCDADVSLFSRVR
ncbi:hypothetical protein EI94DRAFT_937086 [Lactarius quietus]|nr:hypothetical protein EI94DRAFT_937086 [Lactarius quietus]